jgi:hypothetical protein
MNTKTPQILTVLGVLTVIVIALLLAVGADSLFPRPTPILPAATTIAKATATAIKSANTPTPTAMPKTLSTVSLILAYTDDTQGYLDPCSA